MFDLLVEDFFNSFKTIIGHLLIFRIAALLTFNPIIAGATLLLLNVKTLDKFSAAEAKDSPPALTLLVMW